MVLATLSDKTKIHCLLKTEAMVLDQHVDGYFSNGISISDGNVVFDIGANVGVFSLRSIQKGPKVRVFACEPIPNIFACLQKNAEDFGKERLVALPYGVADQEGEATFSYYPRSPALSTSDPNQWDDDSFTVAVEGTMRNPPPHLWFVKYLPRFICRIIAKRILAQKKEFQCTLKTISQLIEEHRIEHIHLLKIDCEGAELAALKGIASADWSKISQAVIEVRDIDGRLDKIQKLLLANGLPEQVVEKEEGLEQTNLYNIFAKRRKE